MSGIAYAGLGQVAKTAEGAVKLYDDWADTYDACLVSWGYEAPERVAAHLKERLGTDARVLDLGCGTGLSGVALTKAGLTGAHVGVDISPKSVEIALKLGCYSGGAFVGSLEEPFSEEVVKKGPYDAVITVGVLSYVHKFDLLWPEVLKVLAPGGLLVTTHRCPFYSDDMDGIQTEAAKHVVSGEWSCQLLSEPMPYMPKNPDPAESVKRINYIIFRKAGGKDGGGPGTGTGGYPSKPASPPAKYLLTFKEGTDKKAAMAKIAALRTVTDTSLMEAVGIGTVDMVGDSDVAIASLQAVEGVATVEQDGAVGLAA